MWNEDYIYNLVSFYIPSEAEILTESNSEKPSIHLYDMDKDSIPEIMGKYKYHGQNHAIVLKNYFGFWYPVDLNAKDHCHSSVNLYPVVIKTKEGNKWGYINNIGQFIIAPQFDDAQEFQSNGLAIVEKNSLWGIIDRWGEFILDPKYKNIMPFNEGRASVVDDQGFKIIDDKGNMITKKAYNYIGPFNDGRALVSTTNTHGQSFYGYLNRNGKEVIPLKYQSGYGFKNEQALVKVRDNHYALINTDGEELYTYTYGIMGDLGDGLIPFKKDFNSKYGYVGVKGNVVIPEKYVMAQSFHDHRAIVNMSEDIYNKYGVIDQEGNNILQPIYNEIMDLGNSRMALGNALDEEKPYIGSIFALANSNTGKILTEFIYTSIGNFHQNHASASTGKETFFMDKNGEKDRSLPIIHGEGFLSFVDCLIKANIDNRFFYMDKNGTIVWRPNDTIQLNKPYEIVENKYNPHKNYIVYYPSIAGIKGNSAQKRVNNELKKLSLAKPLDETPSDYTYDGDYSVEFYKKNLLVLKLHGYEYYFGAAHGMPIRKYPHVDLKKGKFYQLKDLFKSGSNYVEVISKIIKDEIENDPEYEYVFPNSFEEIDQEQSFYVNENNLYIYFEPYEIAPYAAGFPTFPISFDELMPIINKRGSFWNAFH